MRAKITQRCLEGLSSTLSHTIEKLNLSNRSQQEYESDNSIGL